MAILNHNHNFVPQNWANEHLTHQSATILGLPGANGDIIWGKRDKCETPGCDAVEVFPEFTKQAYLPLSAQPEKPTISDMIKPEYRRVGSGVRIVDFSFLRRQRFLF